MKYEKLVYGIGSVTTIVGATMKILHLPNANPILLFGLLGTIVFQTWHVAQLKKKIKELETK